MADDQGPPEPFDATDPRAQDNAARDVARKKREDADVLRTLMHNKHGRAFLYRFLEGCHIYGDTFAGENSHTSAFNQGQENVGKRLMVMAMDASPDLYVQMIKEQREEESRLDAVRRQEERSRRERDEPPSAEQMLAVQDLPPPAGYPGHKPPKMPNE
jgi:hypothetical protein